MNKSESKYFNTAVKMDLALIAVLEEKQFEYITVKELCQKAGVNRSTFYLHYENTYDLLNETARYLLDDFFSCFSMQKEKIYINFSHCDLSALNFITDTYLTPYLNYVKKNKKVFYTALLHVKTLGFEEAYQRLYENVFDPILDRFSYPKQDRGYVMKYYLNGINAIITEWLSEDCEKSLEEIADIIKICIYGLQGQINPFLS